MANVGPGLGVGREKVGATDGPMDVEPPADGRTAEVVGDGEPSRPEPRTYTPTRTVPSPDVATRPPPDRFATNSARSAASRTSSAFAPSAGNDAVPADASSERARPRHSEPGPTTPFTAARMRSAIGPTWSCSVPGRSTANSSPP